MQQKAKFYPKTEKIVPIPDELTLIGEKSPLDIAREQKGKDDLFEEHGKFIIVDFINSEDAHFEYDAAKSKGNEVTEVSEEEWQS